MEHYRSTLAVTALAVLGLFAAARVLHPGNFEDPPRPARPVAAQAAAGPAPAPAAAVTWVDPPFDLYLRPSATDPGTTVLAPRLTASLPPGMTMAPVLPAAMAAADRPQPVRASRRAAAQRLGRARPAASARDRTAKAAPAAVRAVRDGSLDVSAREPGPARDGEG